MSFKANATDREAALWSAVVRHFWGRVSESDLMAAARAWHDEIAARQPAPSALSDAGALRRASRISRANGWRYLADDLAEAAGLLDAPTPRSISHWGMFEDA